MERSDKVLGVCRIVCILRPRINSVCLGMACKYQEPCQKQPSNSSKETATGSAPSRTQPHPEDAEGQADNRSDCVPCKYKLLAWPLGITTWGIFGTLFVIAWQSWGTADAATSAARGIEIQERSQRAWLFIRSAMKDYEPSIADKQLRFWWAIENRGKMPAQILETQCSYELLDSEALYPPAKSIPPYFDPIKWGGFLIAPKENQKSYTMLQRNGNAVTPPLLQEDIDKIGEGTLHLRAYGHVKYIDGLGAERESRFIEYYVWPLPERPLDPTGFRPLINDAPEYTKCT